MTATFRSDLTYRERLDETRCRQPKCCPVCADDSEVNPTFDGNIWDCGACGNVFDAGDSR